LLWVPLHVSITGNENANTAAKETLNERVQSTEKYHSVGRTETSKGAIRKKTTELKERKPHTKSTKDTQKMTRRDQVVISRLRTGY
jgi:hypothetical protein